MDVKTPCIQAVSLPRTSSRPCLRMAPAALRPPTLSTLVSSNAARIPTQTTWRGRSPMWCRCCGVEEEGGAGQVPIYIYMYTIRHLRVHSSIISITLRTSLMIIIYTYTYIYISSSLSLNVSQARPCGAVLWWSSVTSSTAATAPAQPLPSPSSSRASRATCPGSRGKLPPRPGPSRNCPS